MKDIYITIYTKEKGRLELSREEWIEFDDEFITLHRKDGPAREYTDGHTEWYIDGKLHRIDGPAIEYNRSPGRNRRMSWYIDGEFYLASQYNQIIEEVKSLPLELRLTDPRWWVREMK